MALKSNSAQLKLGEKLVILNDRALGMLTRIYNMKKACADPKSRPSFLNGKQLEAAISQISKKFPVIDLKRNSVAFSSVNDMKSEIMKNLSLYYYTFADLLDLKDHILRMLTTMDANQCKLDITLNYDLTAGYLNLVVNYMCLMVLLSRVDDRKVVLGLFNAAYNFVNNGNEPSFPRLGQMIVDYENPIKKLCEDFSPLNGLIHMALTSLRGIYFRRNISAEQLRKSSVLSLTADSQYMTHAAQTPTIACEYLPLDVMDRWIIFCITICHNALLNDQGLYGMYVRALQHGLVLRLFRDESVLVFPMIQQLFESIKGYHKKVQELKELSMVSLQTSGSLHAHRRQFLRAALRELYFLIKDQPGLLGPKALFVWMGLSFARDEVLWILRHADVWHLVNVHKKTKNGLNNIVVDKYLPELIFYMMELKLLVQKYSNVLSQYYTDFVCDHDAVKLSEMLHSVNGVSQSDEILIRSFVDSILNIKNDEIDLRALRLDWFRFQANISVNRSSFFHLKDNVEFAITMNTTVFHLKMIDVVEEMLRETSDLSIYCFYPQIFESHVKQCLNFPAQSRYAIAYAAVAGNFTNSLHEMCPEEHQLITENGLMWCNMVLDDLTKRITEVLLQMSADELILVQNVSPQGCAKMVAAACQHQHNQNSSDKQKNHHQNDPLADAKMPGHESMRSMGDGGVTNADKNYLYLVELCQAIGLHKEIFISDYTFIPREYLVQQLERYFLNILMRYLRPNEMGSGNGGVTENPRRPSEMFTFLSAQLAILQNVDTCLSLDLMRLANDTLLQQTQLLDSHGAETMTAVYSRWYLEVLLRRASTGQLIYSDHLQVFIANTDTPQVPFTAERYTDARELRALCQIIGPYGIKTMAERLTWHVSCQIIELYKIIREHAETLKMARKSYDQPEKLREIVALLSVSGVDATSANHHQSAKDRRYSSASTLTSNSSSSSSNASAGGSPLESVLQRVTIIGEILAFRDMLFRALHNVLEQRTPFLVVSLNSMLAVADDMQKIAVGEMLAAVGVRADVDLALVNAVQRQAEMHKFNPVEHYNLSCLLFVFIAIALPKLAVSKQSFFKASLIAAQNNCHTIPLAVNTMAGALFFLHFADRPEMFADQVRQRMDEFLALTSGGLLQIVGTADAEHCPNHRSVYILLDRLVRDSPWLNFYLLESCFPYTLLRASYLNCYHQEEEQDGDGANNGGGGGGGALSNNSSWIGSTA